MDAKILVLKFLDYSTYIKGFSKATLTRYKAVMRNFFNSANIIEIEDITEDNIRNFFFNGRTNRKWGANTFIQYHKTLGVFFRWCIKEGYMAENSIKDLEIPMLSNYLFSGMRKKELLNLKLTDIDLENMSIFIRQGKGSKDRVLPVSLEARLDLFSILKFPP